MLPPCCIYLSYLNHITGLAYSSFKFQLTFLIRESNGRPLSLRSHVAETSFTDVAVFQSFQKRSSAGVEEIGIRLRESA